MNLLTAILAKTVYSTFPIGRDPNSILRLTLLPHISVAPAHSGETDFLVAPQQKKHPAVILSLCKSYLPSLPAWKVQSTSSLRSHPLLLCQAILRIPFALAALCPHPSSANVKRVCLSLQRPLSSSKGILSLIHLPPLPVTVLSSL